MSTNRVIKDTSEQWDALEHSHVMLSVNGTEIKATLLILVLHPVLSNACDKPSVSILGML